MKGDGPRLAGQVFTRIRLDVVVGMIVELALHSREQNTKVRPSYSETNCGLLLSTSRR